MKLLSIIIAMYNAENTIASCIESLQNQTYSMIEIIIIDDGSIDKSSNIVKHYVNVDKRVKLFQKRNEGVSKARNYGIERAAGEYIMFVDSDDTVNNYICEKMINAMEEDNYDMCLCGYNTLYVNKAGEKIISTLPEVSCIKNSKEFDNTFNKLFKKKIYITVWGKLYKKSILVENNIKFYSDITIGEDFIFNLMYLLKTTKIGVVNEDLYTYFVDGTKKEMSLSKNIDIDMRIKGMNIQYSLLKSIKKEKKLGKKLIKTIYIDYLKCCLQICETAIKGGKSNFKSILDIIKNQEPFMTLMCKIPPVDLEIYIYYSLFKIRVYFVFKLFFTLREQIKQLIRGEV